jgi:hypothetical protein
VNYHNHLKDWDKYEVQIQQHFDMQNIIKYGSEKNAQRVLS